MPARDDRRRCRRGEVTPGFRGGRLHPGAGRQGTVPLLRGRHHVLAGRRGDQAARRSALRRDGSERDPLAAGYERTPHQLGRDRVGVPQAARGASAARLRPGRPSVGGGHALRSRRARQALLRRSASSARLHGQARIERAPAGVGDHLRLEPLPREDVEALIPDTIEDELRERIERAAGGNPLFVQEMVAMASETEGDVRFRPTSGPCSPHASTSWRRPSARSWSEARSKGRSSTAAPSRRSPEMDR